MRTKIPLLAVMVSALVLGPTGSAVAGDSSLQPLQLAKVNNSSQGGGAAKRAPKKK